MLVIIYLILFAVVFAYGIYTAPYGSEDARGFHYEPDKRNYDAE
jgi:hypothetical protein